MKATIYLRVAKRPNPSDGKGKFTVKASNVPDPRPLETTTAYLPTASFALDVDIPESEFKRASQVLATVELPEGSTKAAVQIHNPEAPHGE